MPKAHIELIQRTKKKVRIKTMEARISLCDAGLIPHQIKKITELKEMFDATKRRNSTRLILNQPSTLTFQEKMTHEHFSSRLQK
jgi:hypothetical protein